MSDKAYDVLVIIQRWLVALGVAYKGLALIWGFPFANEVVASITVICTFLAVVIETVKAKWKLTHSITINDFAEGSDEDESV